MSAINQITVEVKISAWQKAAILAINLPRAVLGLPPLVPSWCVSIGRAK